MMGTGRAAGARFGGPCSERAGGSSAPLPGQCCLPGRPGTGSYPQGRAQLTGYRGRVLPVRLPCATTRPLLSTRRARPCHRSFEASRAFPGSHLRLSPGAITSYPAPGTCRGQGPPSSHRAPGRPVAPRVPSPVRLLLCARGATPAPGALPHSCHSRDCLRALQPRHGPQCPARALSARISYLCTALTPRAPLAGAWRSTALPLLPARDQSTFKTWPFPAPEDDTPAQPLQKLAGQPSPRLPLGAGVPPCRGSLVPKRLGCRRWPCPGGPHPLQRR